MDGALSNQVTFTLNGQTVGITPKSDERLSEALRERLGARDVKIGCNAGDCGACTVLLDGAPVCACIVPVAQAQGLDDQSLAGSIEGDAPAHDLAQRL